MAGRPEGGASDRNANKFANGAWNFLIAVLVASFCLVAQHNEAYAHAALVSSVPAEGAVVAVASEELVLTFNEPVAPLVLKLVRPDGSAIPLDRYEIKEASLVITPPALGEGTHVLSWRVVSADGHPIGGALVFSVGAPSAAGPPDIDATANRPVLAALWLAKLCLYLGLFFGVGGVFFSAWIGTPTNHARSIIRTTVGLGLVATPFAIGAQGLDALELPLSAIVSMAAWQAGFATSFGNTVSLAALSLVVALSALSVGIKALAQPLSALALAGVGLALTASGHAADAPPHWLTRPAVFLHATGIAFWAGALIPLASLLAVGGPESVAALKRFSRLIPLPLAALVVAGCVLAVIQVETPSALLSTSYGRVLFVKLALVAALFALAIWNRWRLTPRVATGDEASNLALLRTVRAEILLIALALGTVALWRFTPPPRVIAIEAAKPATTHLHGDKAMADVSIAPGRSGKVAVQMFVMTPAFDPLPAEEVTLVMSNPAVGIEPIKHEAKLVEGTWRIGDLTIPLAGRWTIRLDILVSDFEMAKLEGEVEIRP